MVRELTMLTQIHSHLTNKYSFSKFLEYLYKGKPKDFKLGENNGRKKTINKRKLENAPQSF